MRELGSLIWLALVGAFRGQESASAIREVNGCADLSFAPKLACFRWHDDGASVGVMIVGERSLPDAITSHSSIK